MSKITTLPNIDNTEFKLNHHPSQQGIWFPYDGGRYKDVYHLKLHSGEVVRVMFPNGCGWYPDMGSTCTEAYRDEDVAEVMLAPDKDVSEFRYTGQSRIDHSVAMFGSSVPDL